MLIESKKAGKVVLQSDSFIEDVVSACGLMLEAAENEFSAYGSNLNKIFASEDATDKVVGVMVDIISDNSNRRSHGQA